jgi:origin recognition complex subunit 4
MSKDHKDQFHVVRLNGFIHTDDKLALREIWRQLGKEMEVEDELVSKVRKYTAPSHSHERADLRRQITTPTPWPLS